MNQNPRSLDSQDFLFVTGLCLLGYGLFLVYPPSAFIAIGICFMAPTVLSARRTG